MISGENDVRIAGSWVSRMERATFSSARGVMSARGRAWVGPTSLLLTLETTRRRGRSWCGCCAATGERCTGHGTMCDGTMCDGGTRLERTCLQAGKEDGIMTSTLKIGVEVPLGIFLRSRWQFPSAIWTSCNSARIHWLCSQTNGAATFCVASQTVWHPLDWGLRNVVAALCQSPSAPEAPPNANTCFRKEASNVAGDAGRSCRPIPAPHPRIWFG